MPMRETDLVTLRVTLMGWFDTGATSYDIALARYHYAPDKAVSERLGDRFELLRYHGERFLNESAQEDLTRWILKAVDQYSTAMLLP